MPQMSPINWLSLFLLFSLIFIMFCSVNYYFILPTQQKKMKEIKIIPNSMNWKW